MNFHNIFTGTINSLSKLSDYRLPVIIGAAGLILLVSSLIYSAITDQPQDTLVFDPEITTQTKNSQESQKIVVDVAGAVIKPGVYTLSQNARVQEALIAAGGLGKNSDRNWVAKNLNLAAKLIDGAKVYIPAIGEPSAQNQTGDGSIQVNINSASTSELEKLPGIGGVTAEKIISARPYGTVDELVSKKAVSNAVFEKIKEKVTIY